MLSSSGNNSRVNLVNQSRVCRSIRELQPFIAWSCETTCAKELAIKIILEENDKNSISSDSNEAEIKLAMCIRSEDKEVLKSLCEDLESFVFAISGDFFFLL